jgi:hypothetical protein
MLILIYPSCRELHVTIVTVCYRIVIRLSSIYVCAYAQIDRYTGKKGLVQGLFFVFGCSVLVVFAIGRYTDYRNRAWLLTRQHCLLIPPMERFHDRLFKIIPKSISTYKTLVLVRSLPLLWRQWSVFSNLSLSTYCGTHKMIFFGSRGELTAIVYNTSIIDVLIPW